METMKRLVGVLAGGIIVTVVGAAVFIAADSGAQGNQIQPQPIITKQQKIVAVERHYSNLLTALRNKDAAAIAAAYSPEALPFYDMFGSASMQLPDVLATCAAVLDTVSVFEPTLTEKQIVRVDVDNAVVLAVGSTHIEYKDGGRAA